MAGAGPPDVDPSVVRPGGGHLAGDGLLKPVVLLVLFLGKGGGSHRGGRVLVDILLVDREDLRAAVAVFQLEVADRLELNRLVVGRSSSDIGTSTSKSVSSKMSFWPFFTAGGGVADRGDLGLAGSALPGSAWRVWPGLRT